MGFDYSKDPNTDILTDKAISQYARHSLKNSFGKTIYLTILELDNFNMLIDKFGEPFGEEIFSSTAKIVKDAVGSCGMVRPLISIKKFSHRMLLENYRMIK